MNMTVKQTLSELGNNRPKLVNRIEQIIDEDEKNIVIRLKASDVIDNMMYDASVAFEGWSIPTYACIKELEMNKQVILDLDGRLEYEQYEGCGNLGRFLYRAMKFSKQYKSWFRLSQYLEDEVGKFESYISSEDAIFINNIGEDEAGKRSAHGKENWAEGWLSEGRRIRDLVKTIDIGDNSVNRQLAVGLFADGKVETGKEIFTGGHSAVDLWTWNKDEISIFELKTDNVMLGIISEIYFYANYIYDLVRADGLFTKNTHFDRNENHRGYEIIADNDFNVVNAIMLADNNRFHPFVNSKSLDIMNNNGDTQIRFFMESYPYNNSMH